MGSDMQDLKLSVARMEEHVKQIRTDISELKNVTPRLYLDVELIKRDKKWARVLAGMIASFFGGASAFIYDYFKH